MVSEATLRAFFTQGGQRYAESQNSTPVREIEPWRWTEWRIQFHQQSEIVWLPFSYISRQNSPEVFPKTFQPQKKTPDISLCGLQQHDCRYDHAAYQHYRTAWNEPQHRQLDKVIPSKWELFEQRHRAGTRFIQIPALYFSLSVEVILPRPHFQRTVQPSYTLDVPFPDLKSLYPLSE